MNPVSARGIMKQTIEATSEKLRTFEYEIFAGNKGENQLMRYRVPGRTPDNCGGSAVPMARFSVA